MPRATEEHPIVLFDGVCHLCHAAVRFIIATDREGTFRFAPLESDLGRRLSDGRFEDGAEPDSVLLVDDGDLYEGAEAALRIARRLGPPWSALGILRIVPRSWRERLYASVARRRYRWFGRLDHCPVPDPDLRERFLP
ncbi:MAG: DCC1-like thiol-disulfide oxidoreductase family protein [Gemmatimonadota bacterium]